MAEIKIPKLLHKMSVAHQKAWYKKNNMPLPSHLTGAEGKSAAQAKKDVGQINKQKAKEKEVAAAKVDRTELIKRAVEKRASRTQIAKLRSAFGGEVPGARYDDPIAMARAGIPIRGYRLGESSKPDASMAMTDQLKMKMISDKDKMTLAKVAALMSSAKNKDKKNEYVRQLGLKAMKAGAIDPARGHSPTRFGREALRKEEVDLVNEDQASDMQKIQSMDKGSMVGGKTELKTHLNYLNAMHTHQKKYGLDTVKTKKKIEGINRTLVQMGEEVELDEMDKSQPSSSRGAEGLALGKEAKPVKRDEVKSDALKILQKQYKKVKEEVEQVDEAAKTKKEKLKALLYRDRSNVRELGKGAGLTDAQKAAARKAIANEEVELDEGSKRMSAAVKLQRAFDREKTASDASRKRGKEELEKARAEYAKKQVAKTNEEVEQIDETNGEYNKLGQPKPGSVDVDPKPGDVLPSYKKRKPAMYKPKNHVAEDSESVNELKDATLKSYLEKRPSPKIRDIARKETVGKPEERQKDIERANLTRIGRARAKAKLLKRNPPPRKKPEYDPTDRGYGQGRYMGDSIELEGSVMNEVSKKEAEAMFGGPVKEKPKMPAGKQPEGYRYVRSLARKAMKAGLKKEEVKDAADVGEYDYEGDMAKSQLRSIMANSKRMHDMLEENTNLPEWVQSKITLAEDYIVTAANYMEGEMNEEFTDEELAELIEAKMTDAQMKKREKYVKSMKPVSDWEKRYPGRGEQVMYATATKMAMKEEVEQIDEIKKEKLVQYVQKAVGEIGRLGYEVGRSHGLRDAGVLDDEIDPEIDPDEEDRNRHKLEKRTKGVARASTKLAKEEVEIKEEGRVAVTPKEKSLAAHHGDKTKITYGDVIKARIKSAAEKAMKKGK